jgi:hypothetical protein
MIHFSFCFSHSLPNVYKNIETKRNATLVKITSNVIEKGTSQQEGFISAKIHKGLDGRRVVNYMQRKSKLAIEKILKKSKSNNLP